ncbi:VOC family protein [Variovorax sp. PCZ-1]|uniref:VOC family protein n=1 Tax=Variovorax sp. PCZ-1 TaxID=2835533 RepID=UPI001BCD248E|nr:VOC family protein [Variovorax sp. PCZ-1]MBS7807838.1 VOC family protein [Variovorax sp. PCZ-1]
MYDHIGIRVKDFASSQQFYKALLATLGHVPGYQDASQAGFGPPDAPAFWLYPSSTAKANGCHIAFRASSHEQVDAFYKAGLKAGARDNGAPGLRLDYSPTYYAAYLLDPDGNNVEAVCP